MKLETKLALLVSWISLVVLLAVSGRMPLGPASSEYAALVNQAEGLVRTIGVNGPQVLAQSDVKVQFEQLGTRPLAPLLSAWSALSVGRVGLLSGSSSVRLPWLILAASATLSVFLIVLERWGAWTAVASALWLLGSPGFLTSALSVTPSALPAWSGILVLALYVCAMRERGARARCALSVGCGALAFIAFGLSYSALWIVPVLLLHAWGRYGHDFMLASERGHLPLPLPALLVIAALPLATLCFDPVLWLRDPPAIIGRVFSSEETALALGPRVAPFFLAGLLASCGLGALAWRALARRFATGEFRPERDRAAIGLLLALTLGGAGAAFGFRTLGPEFGVELLRPVLACLAAIGAAAFARRFVADHARLAEAALLVFTLLVR